MTPVYEPKLARPNKMIVTPGRHLLLRSTEVYILSEKPLEDGQVTIRFTLGNTTMNDTCKLEDLDIL